MTASQLKYKVETRGTESLFFTRSSMKFLGDTMRNYGVRERTVTDNMDNNRGVFELYRKHPVSHGVQGSAYFDSVTFERVHRKVES
jgi:hypothetical protein